jgi:hypothetical protein
MKMLLGDKRSCLLYQNVGDREKRFIMSTPELLTGCERAYQLEVLVKGLLKKSSKTFKKTKHNEANTIILCS